MRLSLSQVSRKKKKPTNQTITLAVQHPASVLVGEFAKPLGMQSLYHWNTPHLTAAERKRQQQTVLLHPSLHLGRVLIYICEHTRVQMFAHACVPTSHSWRTPKISPDIFVCTDTGSPLWIIPPTPTPPPFCFSLMLYSFYSEQASLFLSSEEVQGIMSKASGLIKEPSAIPTPHPHSSSHGLGWI